MNEFSEEQWRPDFIDICTYCKKNNLQWIKEPNNKWILIEKNFAKHVCNNKNNAFIIIYSE